MIKVRILQQKKEIEVEGPRKVKEILREIGAREGTTVVVKSGKILTPDVDVKDGDTVDVISVVSGG